MINIFIIQGCQSGSVGRDGQTGPVVYVVNLVQVV